ncbi:M24 family metallopeptidase [Paraburkholderia haematera]|uniref:Peptidase n=1 Tax=Paraburkholderia haematera TaxID=2793077 RepID=A0ABN7LV24_9BURK|nr:Xaa-Pro peptidase family protein [Paraburkholderia haematera]CAE6765798.1 putative peptidase [Paraburkholderia haematera]
MSNGIGGSKQSEALERLVRLPTEVDEISVVEYRDRIRRVQLSMKASGVDALYINAGTNLLYFTGIQWYPSERLFGAVIPADGELVYIAPCFEKRTLCDAMKVAGEVVCWHEDESSYATFYKALGVLGITSESGKKRIAICATASVAVFFGMKQLSGSYELISAEALVTGLRSVKSLSEIALIQSAMNMTLRVHEAAASILHEGMSTVEVRDFIEQAHRKLGASGSTFCSVLFGEATSYPHGVKDIQYLKKNDIVLIDTGCRYKNYNSDITRTYVFGDPTDRQRFVWDTEKAAQAAAFKAAQLGVPCCDVDRAARQVVEAAGFGPGYQLPGLPHRTGHGIGLDLHEAPNLVGNDTTPLEAGMCFSNEPMISIPGEFGIRHEDHFYMTSSGPVWFTQPAHSIEDPFGLS